MPPEIEDPQILHINSQPPHAALMPYARQEEALAGKRQASPFYQSLNGQWKFNWVKHPKDRPVDFHQPAFDVSGWKEIPVPSCWQVQGYGTPYYRNVGYTFRKDWPRVMSDPPERYTAFDERNPVGSYRREFEVPASWDGRNVFLTFDGVDSAFFLWINGKQVGYFANSRNAAEFDVTSFLQKGKNTVAVEVYRYNAGSYLEDQDMWRLSGIFRNVFLWSAPTVHVRDFFIKPDLDAQYRNGVVNVEASVRNYGNQPAEQRELSVALHQIDGRAVENATAKVSVPALQPGEEQTVKLSFPVTDPAKWTAESPSLYVAVLKLMNEPAPELLSTRIGFRKIEIKDRVFMINGVPVKLKGVNRHEMIPESGHTISEESMIRDLELIKQGNCNHVRTSHYTNDPRWYELCDEWGVYLMAEANAECHGYMGVLDREPAFEKMFVDRNIANTQALKNHASVIFWSMGNECGGGSNLESALRAVKAIDPTRPTHYEGFGIGRVNPADIDSQMYTHPDAVKRHAESSELTKPFYLCEYAHAMFNSMGAIGEYNDLFDKYPALMGGAIWEWQDQGLWNRRDEKRTFIAYGGGFGEYPNDQYFIHKGVIFSDRTPKPHYPEMKRAYQWVRIERDESGAIRLRNRYAFTDLSNFTGSWTLSADGAVVKDGKFDIPAVAPGQEATISLDDLKNVVIPPGSVCYLRVSISLKQEQRWAPAGFEVAAGQFKVAAPPMVVTALPSPGTVKLEENESLIRAEGEGFVVVFDKASGAVVELSREGRNILLPNGGPELHLWRAPHRNDDNWAWRNWTRTGLDQLSRKVQSVNALQVDPSTVRVEVVTKLEGKARFAAVHVAHYTINGEGLIASDNAVSFQGYRMPLGRIGVRMQLKRELNDFTYFGRGPMENYADRKRGSDVGLYSSTVAEQMTPYAKPMESGNHEDVTWAALRGGDFPSLMALADGAPLQVSAIPYSDEVMLPIEYRVDLPESDRTVLTIAAKTLGVGSAGCGPRPLPQYIVSSESTVFSYLLQLLPSGSTNLAEASRARFISPADRAKPAPVELPPTFTALPAKVIHASSFEPGEGLPEHVVDGKLDTFWHSRWSRERAPMPHDLVIDYGRPLKLAGLTYIARMDSNSGQVRDYEVYLSKTNGDWGQPVAKGSFPKDELECGITFPATEAQYLKFVVLSEQNSRRHACIAELQAIEADGK